MKRLLVLAMAFAVAMPIMADTETAEGYTWNYNVNGDGTVEICGTKYWGSGQKVPAILPMPTGAVKIPSTLGGKPVTRIGEYAFFGCGEMTHVTIPDGVTSVGDEVFFCCASLASVTIPDSVTSIGGNVFYGCDTSIYDTNSIAGVKLVDGWVIGYTTSLSGGLDLTSVRGIGAGAFSGCGALTSVTMPASSVRSIGTGTFRGCSALTRVTMPDGVTSIGDYAFYGCSRLTRVAIPDGVVSIGEKAFANCSGLVVATIPNSVADIGENAFDSCTGIESVAIGGGVTNFGESAFASCTALESVTIAEGATEIGDRAFYDCRNLANIAIPNSVVRIGIYGSYNGVVMTYAFYNCGAIKNVMIPQCACTEGLAATFPHAYQSIENVVVAEGVTRIADKALLGCDRLRAVKLPSSLLRMGDEVFSDCASLTEVRFDGDAPDVGDDIYVGTPRSLVTYVYEGSVGWAGGVSADLPFEWCGRSLEGVSRVSLLSISIVGDASVESGSSATYTCTAMMSDGSTKTVVPDWSIASGEECAAISASGVLTANDTDADCTVVLLAIYAEGGVTKTASKTVSVVARTPAVNTPEWTIDRNGCLSRVVLNGASEVVIPDGVKTIGADVFLEMDVTSVSIPEGVTNIDEYAFAYCANLKSVTIPASMERIAQFAFLETGLAAEGIVFAGDRGGIDISPSAFRRTPYDLSLDFTLQIVDGRVVGFVGACHESVAIPDGVKAIGEHAFEWCDQLLEVLIPASVVSIGAKAFYCCNNLTNYVFEGNRPNVGDNAFGAYTPNPNRVIYVRRGSIGWADAIPGIWNGMRIEYLEDETVPIPDPDPIQPEIVVVTNFVVVVTTNVVTDVVTLTNIVTQTITKTNVLEIAEEAVIVSETVQMSEPDAAFVGADKAKMNGVVFDVDGVMRGIIQIETAKATAKGVKVKGFVILEDGKKVAIKGVTATIENGRLEVMTTVGKLGTLMLSIGGDGFIGELGLLKVVSAEIGADAGVLSGSLTLKNIDASGKVKNRKIAVGGVVLDGTAAGTVTEKGGKAKAFAAEFE